MGARALLPHQPFAGVLQARCGREGAAPSQSPPRSCRALGAPTLEAATATAGTTPHHPLWRPKKTRHSLVLLLLSQQQPTPLEAPLREQQRPQLHVIAVRGTHPQAAPGQLLATWQAHALLHPSPRLCRCSRLPPLRRRCPSPTHSSPPPTASASAPFPPSRRVSTVATGTAAVPRRCASRPGGVTMLRTPLTRMLQQTPSSVWGGPLL